MNALFAIIMFLMTKWVEEEDGQYTNGNIVAGAGYSEDSQQVAPHMCYNATGSPISAQQGYMQLYPCEHFTCALSFSQLENKLGMSVSVGGKYGMFSADAKASYLRSVQDKDYSMSLNYYGYATNTVRVQLAGYGKKALTKSGKGFYKGGKNPYFGLVCGDYYINSYEQGALLLIGLNIKCSSSNSKKEFEQNVGATFADIVTAAECVKNVVTKYKITGSIVLQAFQIGGEPSQLAKILNKDSTFQYYALTCSLTAMDNCIKAAGELFDYARNDFYTQFSFQNNTGLTPLGIRFSRYNPINYIGLIPAASLVTDEVVQYRDELTSSLKENQYYQQKFYSFLDEGYYPVKLDDAFIDGVNSILSKTNSNVQVLMQPHGGAADCFNYPDKCKNIKASIDSQLQNVTISAVKLLEDMKHSITIYTEILYNTGGGSEASWNATYKPPGVGVLVDSVNVTDTEYEYTGYYSDGVHPRFPIHFLGHSLLLDTEHYSGSLCTRRDNAGNWLDCRSYTEKRQLSPFFFEAFSA